MQKLILTYYHHSGFSVHDGDILLVFDYWRGEHGEVKPEFAITEEFLRRFRKVVVFVSHEHPDHFDHVIYQWREIVDVQYIVAYDMPVGTRGRRMQPGDEMTLASNLKVWAYGSTDLGVSFLVDFNGIMLFHAGDLNYWHWCGEASPAEIEQADADFRREVRPLEGKEIDVAFFPVDPRQGDLYDAGANYFIMTVKPRLLIPMHFWGRKDMMQEFVRRCRTAETEIAALTSCGEQMLLTMEDDRNMNITTALPEIVVGGRMHIPVSTELPMRGDIDLSGLTGADPFGETDLPVDID